MIINIRGTSGSGKSTLVRRVLANYHRKSAVRIAGRRQPIGYIYYRNPSDAAGDVSDLGVIGHYETPCGGCDTIASMDTIYENVRKAHELGLDVLYEGLLISADANRVIGLHEAGLPLHVIALDTPLDVCLASVNQRRLADAEAKGKPYKGDVNPKNTQSKFSGVKSSFKRIEAAGASISWENRESAYERIKKEFQL